MNGDWRPTLPRYERERGGEYREPTGQYREPTGLAWLGQQHIQQQQQQQVACSRNLLCAACIEQGHSPAGTKTRSSDSSSSSSTVTRCGGQGIATRRLAAPTMET